MNGATHAMSGFSTCPFHIFGRGREAGFDLADRAAGNRGDTVGADVRIGHGATRNLDAIRGGDIARLEGTQ